MQTYIAIYSLPIYSYPPIYPYLYIHSYEYNSRSMTANSSITRISI